MKKEFLANVKRYIPQYNIERILLDYGKQAKKRGYYKRGEFMRICLWKSSRQKRKYKSNSEKKIKDITKEAFLLIDERARMEKLCKLKGVGIPVASALLTFHSINKYALIDVRCIKELQTQNLISWSCITYNSWVNYIQLLQRLSKGLKITPRKFEKGLFAYHREKQIGMNFQNVY
jgi:thermostable 8-oxoguanine DNA glycosylase